MYYPKPLTPAKLIKRYKRFLADVILPDGSEKTVYCANTGAMTGCATSGDTVWLLSNDNPKRKYALSWELTHSQAGHFICVNTARANELTEEAINNKIISELVGYQQVKREVPYGSEKSRIDFLLSADNKADCYVEVKSCTLLENGQGYFPDTVTTRGQKHLRELIEMKALGHRAVLLFAVLHTGINSVKAAAHLDKSYGELFKQAQTAGVEIIAYQAKITDKALYLSKRLLVS